MTLITYRMYIPEQMLGLNTSEAFWTGLETDFLNAFGNVIRHPHLLAVLKTPAGAVVRTNLRVFTMVAQKSAKNTFKALASDYKTLLAAASIYTEIDGEVEVI